MSALWPLPLPRSSLWVAIATSGFVVADSEGAIAQSYLTTQFAIAPSSVAQSPAPPSLSSPPTRGLFSATQLDTQLETRSDTEQGQPVPLVTGQTTIAPLPLAPSTTVSLAGDSTNPATDPATDHFTDRFTGRLPDRLTLGQGSDVTLWPSNHIRATVGPEPLTTFVSTAEVYPLAHFLATDSIKTLRLDRLSGNCSRCESWSAHQQDGEALEDSRWLGHSDSMTAVNPATSNGTPMSSPLNGSTDVGIIAQTETESGVIPQIDPNSLTDENGLPSDPLIPDSDASPEPTLDPELGILRVRPVTNSLSTVLDPELGILRLRTLPPIRERRRPVSIVGRLSFFGGDNLLARSDPETDSTVQMGLALRAVPRLGSRTFLVSSAEVTNLRYSYNPDFNYNELEFRLGVFHYITRRLYTDVQWRNQQFFRMDEGDRFLNNHEVRGSIGRIDPLNSTLELSSSYQFQATWSDPVERSHLSHRLQLGLTKDLESDLDATLFYQWVLSDFTQQDRYDSYHQLLAQLRYRFSDTTSLTVFGGARWGNSTHSQIDFDTTLFGLSFIVNVPLF